MNSIPDFSRARVLVVGDIMLDRYWHGDTGRISPEAPVPVVRVDGEEMRLGGAGNVALNLASLGVATTLIGVVGDDEAGRFVRELLEKAGVDAPLIASATHPTIAKLRIISRNQQLIRLDFERAFDVDQAFSQHDLEQRLDAELARCGAVVCSDYGKGTLAHVGQIIERAAALDKPVLVDPKGVDWNRYRGATVITPNLSEFEAVAGASDNEDALESAANGLRENLDLGALLVTRSERGMSLFRQGGAHHLPAQAQEVFDVTGAGDTVIALLAAGLAAGQSLEAAARLANLGAGVVVAKLGTATVSVEELRRALRERTQKHARVCGETDLIERVREAQAHGERVVMTNGCFDILHPGHVAYLEAARALGDWLVVAVNDDASVRRLKGASRPVNPVAQRIAVLQGLSAVDWVVPFSEDTPQRLIAGVLPDVLVKGGDYRAEDVAGAKEVRAAGGEVRILDFVDGFSTSDIIARIGADGA